MFFFGAEPDGFYRYCSCSSRSLCASICYPLPMPHGRRPPAPFLSQHTMSDCSTPSQDSPSRSPDTGRGGALRRGTFPLILMDIAQSDDADPLLRELDMLKDDALEAADEAIQAPDPALADLCDALRWKAADGGIQAITTVTGAWTPRGLLLTATVTVATSPPDVKVIEHVPLSLAKGGPLLEYVSKDPDALTAALDTRWSPGHAPISASRLRSLVFQGLYTAREKPPAIEADVPPEIQSQKVSHKIHKPISQFVAPHLLPSWDRLRTRAVVAAFWVLPNDVHAVPQTAQIPTAELMPLKFSLLVWASSICLARQYTWAPVANPPSLANKGMWAPDQLRMLLECSVLPVRSGELLHQIEQVGEHSWATAPTIALLQAGIPDTASPPPLTPPSHAPYLAKAQPAPSTVGALFASAAFTPASALYQSQGEAAPAGADQLPSSLLPEQPRLPFSLPGHCWIARSCRSAAWSCCTRSSKSGSTRGPQPPPSPSSRLASRYRQPPSPHPAQPRALPRQGPASPQCRWGPFCISCIHPGISVVPIPWRGRPRVPISRPHRCYLSSQGSPSAFPNPPHWSSRLPPTPRRRCRLPRPPDRPPQAPRSRGSPLS